MSAPLLSPHGQPLISPHGVPILEPAPVQSGGGHGLNWVKACAGYVQWSRFMPLTSWYLGTYADTGTSGYWVDNGDGTWSIVTSVAPDTSSLVNTANPTYGVGVSPASSLYSSNRFLSCTETVEFPILVGGGGSGPSDPLEVTVCSITFYWLYSQDGPWPDSFSISCDPDPIPSGPNAGMGHCFWTRGSGITGDTSWFAGLWTEAWRGEQYNPDILSWGSGWGLYDFSWTQESVDYPGDHISGWASYWLGGADFTLHYDRKLSTINNAEAVANWAARTFRDVDWDLVPNLTCRTFQYVSPADIPGADLWNDPDQLAYTDSYLDPTRSKNPIGFKVSSCIEAWGGAARATKIWLTSQLEEWTQGYLEMEEATTPSSGDQHDTEVYGSPVDDGLVPASVPSLLDEGTGAYLTSTYLTTP